MIRPAVLALLLTGCGDRASIRNDATASGATSVPANIAAPAAKGGSMQEALNTPLPAGELPGLMRRAQAGDDQAAEDLGNHFGVLRQRAEEIRWLSLAANRGHCRSMAELMDLAYQDRDRTVYDRWNGSMREHQCTLGMMLPEAAREMKGSMPMWDDQPEVLWNGL